MINSRRRSSKVINSEVVKIFALFQTEYDRFEYDEDKVRLWGTMLQDVPYRVAEIAAMTLISQSPFPPKLADITKKISEVMAPESTKLTGAEAWGQVMKLVSNYGFYPYDPPEKLEGLLQRLSPPARKVVDQIGYKNICYSPEQELGVIRGQFLKMYEQVQTRDNQDNLIPAGLQKEIKKLSESFSARMLEDGE
jgi:hypothetical protein